MRLSGTRNGKSGEPCRLLYADLRPIRHEPAALLGPDTAAERPPISHGAQRRIAGRPDPLRDVESATYFRLLAGVEPSPAGLVRCRVPDREDRTPSCASTRRRTSAGGTRLRRGGRIYDLASLLLRGPWGRDLRGEPFRRARVRASRHLRPLLSGSDRCLLAASARPPIRPPRGLSVVPGRPPIPTFDAPAGIRAPAPSSLLAFLQRLDPDQRRVVPAAPGPLLVLAGAGAGRAGHRRHRGRRRPDPGRTAD